MARAHAKLGRNATAHTHFRQALALFEQTGDRTSQAHTQLNLGWSLDRQGRYADALGHVRQAMALYEAIGDRPGQADALNAIGWYLTHLGNPVTRDRPPVTSTAPAPTGGRRWRSSTGSGIPNAERVRARLPTPALA